MQYKTRYGVCYDLEETPFTFSYGNMTFHFSTNGHMVKFMDNVTSRVHWLNDSLSRRFRIRVDTDGLAALQLYMMIENRGFYVEFDGKVLTCPDEVGFHGRLLSESDSRTQFEPLTEQLLG